MYQGQLKVTAELYATFGSRGEEKRTKVERRAAHRLLRVRRCQARFHVGRVVDEKRTKVERRAAHLTLRVGRRGVAGPFGITSAKHDSDEKCETRFVIKNES